MTPTSPARNSSAFEQAAIFFLSLMLALVWGGAPALAYIVVLEDGTQISTSKKYELDGDRVILTMPNGTQTSYLASEVDFERTEKLNRESTISQGTVIETVDIGEDQAPEDEASLSDLAAGRGLALPEPEAPGKEAGEAEGPPLPTTPAGFVDLARLERVPLEDEEVSQAIVTYLSGQGHDSVRVLEGVAPEQPFLLMRAATEAQVFESLRDVANTLVQMNERFPDRVAAFSLLLATENGVRAGQFTLTPEKADLLVTGRLEPPGFFVRFVEF